MGRIGTSWCVVNVDYRYVRRRVNREKSLVERERARLILQDHVRSLHKGTADDIGPTLRSALQRKVGDT